MLHDIIFAFWFLLPAAVANMTPIFAAQLPGVRRFDAPIDGGRTFRGKELLGSHKTWRGIITGIIAATLVLAVQQLLYQYSSSVRTLTDAIDYNDLPTLLIGPLFAIGALGGDAIESFFKRQKGVKSGHAWVPFDQIDYIVGALLITAPFATLTVAQYILTIIIWFGMHLLASYAGYQLGLKKRPI